MASSPNRRRRRADGDSGGLEEGEIVPSSSTTSESSDAKNDDNSDSLPSPPPPFYYPPEENTATGQAAMLPVPAPSSGRESDDTISDDGSSGRATNSGMGAGCSRGCDAESRGKGKAIASSSSSDEQNHSVPAVVSGLNHPLEPMPLAFATADLLSSFDIASVRPNFYVGESSTSRQSTCNEPAVAGPSDKALVHQHPAAMQQKDQELDLELRLAPPGPPEQAAPGPAAPPREYRCEICGRSYLKYQQLGGHKTKHLDRGKKFEDGNANPTAACQDTQKHKCKKCGKEFSSGQALGGHMRKHYEGEPIVVVRKSKKQCVEQPAQPGPGVVPPTSLAHLAAVCVAELTLCLGLRIQTGQAPCPSPPAPAVQEGSYIRPREGAPEVQEGTDKGPQVDAPAVQEGGSATTENSAAIGGQQRQDEGADKSSTGSV